MSKLTFSSKHLNKLSKPLQKLGAGTKSLLPRCVLLSCHGETLRFRATDGAVFLTLDVKAEENRGFPDTVIQFDPLFRVSRLRDRVEIEAHKGGCYIVVGDSKFFLPSHGLDTAMFFPDMGGRNHDTEMPVKEYLDALKACKPILNQCTATELAFAFFERDSLFVTSGSLTLKTNINITAHTIRDKDILLISYVTDGSKRFKIVRYERYVGFLTDNTSYYLPVIDVRIQRHIRRLFDTPVSTTFQCNRGALQLIETLSNLPDIEDSISLSGEGKALIGTVRTKRGNDSSVHLSSTKDGSGRANTSLPLSMLVSGMSCFKPDDSFIVGLTDNAIHVQSDQRHLIIRK